MKSPKVFAMHVGKDLVVNGKDIFHHIEAMIKDFRDKSYKNFGIELGIILEEILVGNKAMIS